jgi:hypothetical protein
MLVYHFKERLSVLEQKTNTMFDIINNIVQEIQGIKNHPVQIMPVSNNIPFSNFPIQNIFSQMNDKIVVSEDENDHDDDDSDSDEESDDENIKRINIDLSTNNNETVDDIQVEELNDSDEIDEIDEIDEMEELDEIDMYDHSETKEPEKKEEPVYEIIDSDSYRKMDINALRTLVITKGLAKDTRKMKKMDLIRLLDPSA